MNKKYAQFFAESGLTVTGNTAYGVVGGYEVSALVNTGDIVAPVSIHIACYATALQRATIQNALTARSDIKGTKKMTEFGLLYEMNDITAGRMMKRLPSILDWTIEMLKESGALGVGTCAHCGKPLDGGKKCNVGWATVTLDDDCVTAANTLIDSQNKQFNEKPNNILRGFIGALIGGIAGALTVVLFFVMGFISAISGIVAVALGSWLYTKLGGKPNKVMILIVTVTSLACLIASVFITYIVASGILLSEELGVSVSAIDAFSLLMEDSQFSGTFYLDLVMVILFAILGMGFFVWGMWRKIKLNGRQQHITAQPNEQAQNTAPVEQQRANATIDPFADEQTPASAEQAATDNNDDSSENM